MNKKLPLNSHFVNDLFISYARDDNRDGRVMVVKNELERLLNVGADEGKDCKAWIDEDMDAHIFHEEIKSNIRSTAVLLVLYSRNYARSKECAREKQGFLDALIQQNKVFDSRNRSRIVVLCLDGTDLSTIPEFDSVLIFSLPTQELAGPDGGRSEAPSLLKVANGIRANIALLNSIEKPRKLRPFKVLVASANPILEEGRRKAVIELERLGAARTDIDFDIEYTIPPPAYIKEHLIRLGRCARYQYDVVVHLFTSGPAKELIDPFNQAPLEFADQCQYTFYRQTDDPPDRLVWMDSEVYGQVQENALNPHTRFLYDVKDSIEKGQDPRLAKARLAQSVITDLSKEVVRYVEKILDTRESPRSVMKLVCLDVHSSALGAGFMKAQELEDAPGINAQPYASPEGVADFSNFLKRIEKANHYAILAHKDVSTVWVKNRLLFVHKHTHGKFNVRMHVLDEHHRDLDIKEVPDVLIARTMAELIYNINLP